MAFASSGTINNLVSLEQAINEVEMTAGYPVFWRGQESADWGIRPRVFRTDHLTRDESNMLWTFVTRGLARTSNAPQITDLLLWIQLAQHYGLPTRYLDWSFNPLTALFFAVRENSETKDFNGCLWCLDQRKLNFMNLGEASLLVPTSNLVKRFVYEAFKSTLPSDVDTTPPLPPVIAVGAAELDLRLVVQNAGFTVHRLVEDLDANLAPPILYQYIIPHDAKGWIRRRLRLMGISMASLFPDLGSLAEDTRRAYTD